jgi:hypothetical protein
MHANWLLIFRIFLSLLVYQVYVQIKSIVILLSTVVYHLNVHVNLLVMLSNPTFFNIRSNFMIVWPHCPRLPLMSLGLSQPQFQDQSPCPRNLDACNNLEEYVYLTYIGLNPRRAPRSCPCHHLICNGGFKLLQ